jgi:hypothetical protein
MTACVGRVPLDYPDLLAEGATAAQLCQTDRYYTIAVAFKTTLLAAIVYNRVSFGYLNPWRVYSVAMTLPCRHNPTW